MCNRLGFVITYDDYDLRSNYTAKRYVKSIDHTCPKEDCGFEEGYDTGFKDGLKAAIERLSTRGKMWLEEGVTGEWK